jgi:hypothetical protein
MRKGRKATDKTVVLIAQETLTSCLCPININRQDIKIK